ncbi:MAG: PAS domain S-box protein [Acidobacteria bacterium]|nr:PAS domain S-box protein [Acidobacteriota bacterium]
MVQFNSQNDEILIKIVYYGPGLSGKTTNLRVLHRLINQETHTELFSVDTMEDRTLFFDLMPVQLPVSGRTLKFQVYTVPGQVHYDSTRRIILSGADGIVFVADSQADKMAENVESLNNLHKNLNANRLNIKTIPMALQFNKRDMENIAALQLMNQRLNFRNCPNFPAVALTGQGVMETFRRVVQDATSYLVEKYHLIKDPLEQERIRVELDELLPDRELKEPISTGKKKKDDHVTTLSYMGNEGEVTESEALEKAVKAAEDSANLVNEVKRLNGELKEKNEKLRTLLEENRYIRKFLESVFHHAGLPIATVSPRGIITNWNKAAEQAFGYSKVDAKKLYFSELVSETSVLDLQTLVSLVTSKNQTLISKLDMVTSSGKSLHQSCVLSPITDDKGHVMSITAILSPIEK